MMIAKDQIIETKECDVCHEREAQDLCVACGLCCDGTIFSSVTVKTASDEELCETLGIRVTQGPRKKFFAQPCPMYINRECSIYFENRPGVCVRFRCKLLKRLISGNCSYEEAIELVRKAVHHAEKIRGDIAQEVGASNESILRLYQKWKASSGEDPEIELGYFSLLHRLQRDINNDEMDD